MSDQTTQPQPNDPARAETPPLQHKQSQNTAEAKLARRGTEGDKLPIRRTSGIGSLVRPLLPPAPASYDEPRDDERRAPTTKEDQSTDNASGKRGRAESDVSHTSNSEVATLTIIQTPAPRPKAKTTREPRPSGRISQGPAPTTAKTKASANHAPPPQHNPFLVTKPDDNRSMHASPPTSTTPKSSPLPVPVLLAIIPQGTAGRPPFTGRINKIPRPTTPRGMSLPPSRPQSVTQLNEDGTAGDGQDGGNLENSQGEEERSEGHYSGPEHMYDSEYDKRHSPSLSPISARTNHDIELEDEPLGTYQRNIEAELDDSMLEMINEANARAEEERKAESVTTPTLERFVPTPPSGCFPNVYGTNMTHMYENIDVGQLYSWMKQPGNILFAMPFKDTSHNIHTNRKTADAIGNAVKEIYKLTTISVTPALPLRPPTSPSAAPYTYLISEIPSWVAKDLENRQCIASNDIQFLTFPKRWLGPSHQYIGSLQNLVSTNLSQLSDRGRAKLIQDLIRIFTKHPGLHTNLRDIIADRIGDRREDQDMDYDYDEAIQRFLVENLQIRILETMEPGQIPYTSVNMYINIGKDTHRANLVRTLKTMTFGTYDFGTGTYLAGWKCPSCRGIDHPAGMCSFYDLPLWREITKTTPSGKLLGRGTTQQATDRAQTNTAGPHNQYSNAHLNRGRGRGNSGPLRRPNRPRGRGEGSNSYRGRGEGGGY